jgi:hypothetical protein
LAYFTTSLPLYAIWNNKYKLTIVQKDSSALGANYRVDIQIPFIGSFDTGSNYDDRRIFYNGSLLNLSGIPDQWGEVTDEFEVEYGKGVAINVRSKKPNNISKHVMERWSCWIKTDDGKVSEGGVIAAQGTITKNTKIVLEFKSDGSYTGALTGGAKAKVCWDATATGISMTNVPFSDW